MWYRDGTGRRRIHAGGQCAGGRSPAAADTTPALGDVDGDGDLDLFMGEASGMLNFYRNDGSPTRPLSRW